MDGVLDEAVWQTADVARGFVQAEPREGLAATERTEVRIAYDDRNLYVGAMLYDSEVGALVVNDIKKDFAETAQDAFAVILDTFRDRRNGYVFMTNPEGAKRDYRQDRQLHSDTLELRAFHAIGKDLVEFRRRPYIVQRR